MRSFDQTLSCRGPRGIINHEVIISKEDAHALERAMEIWEGYAATSSEADGILRHIAEIQDTIAQLRAHEIEQESLVHDRLDIEIAASAETRDAISSLREMDSRIDELKAELVSLRAKRDWATENWPFDLPHQVAELLSQRPHLVMPLGFDEFRVLPEFDDDYDRLIFVAETYGLLLGADGPIWDVVYRTRAGGNWCAMCSTHDEHPDQLHFFGQPPMDKVSKESWLATVTAAVALPSPDSHTLWLPGVWTPRGQEEQRMQLAETIVPILRALHAEEVQLRNLHWRQLEELVAEILRDRGLEILLTGPTRDGGRDVVARGELFPGEPMEIAIEAKQRETVGLADVQRALKANEDYPSLMLATAGSFSAGVLAERDRGPNRLRLFLKDGLALSQWINAYGYKRGWKRAPAKQRAHPGSESEI